MGRMTLITGDERRRRWSDEERARILAAVEEPGAVVAEVARRADVCTSLVYRWRREARAAASASGFVQVVVENPPQELGIAAAWVSTCADPVPPERLPDGNHITSAGLGGGHESVARLPHIDRAYECPRGDPIADRHRRRTEEMG